MSEFLRREQASEYLQKRYGAFTRQTLAKLACVGGGPRFRKFGRFPVYTAADLDEWAASRTSAPMASNSDVAAAAYMQQRSS